MARIDATKELLRGLTRLTLGEPLEGRWLCSEVADCCVLSAMRVARVIGQGVSAPIRSVPCRITTEKHDGYTWVYVDPLPSASAFTDSLTERNH